MTATKCWIRGTDDKATAVKPETLKDLVSQNFLIYYHKCKLSYNKVEAFSGTNCLLILDKSSVDGLEKFLFLGEGGCIGLVFAVFCSKFSTLVEHAQAGKLKTLVLWSIDLLCVYSQKEGEPLRTLAEHAMSKLNTLVKISHSKCEIQLYKVITTNKSFEKHFPNIWKRRSKS